MQFNIPVYTVINNSPQIVTILCTQSDNIWTCNANRYPQCLGVNTDLQAAIKEVVDNVKVYHALDQNNSTSTEI